MYQTVVPHCRFDRKASCGGGEVEVVSEVVALFVSC
jgi:hypothetical protein